MALKLPYPTLTYCWGHGGKVHLRLSMRHNHKGSVAGLLQESHNLPFFLYSKWRAVVLEFILGNSEQEQMSAQWISPSCYEYPGEKPEPNADVGGFGVSEFTLVLDNNSF